MDIKKSALGWYFIQMQPDELNAITSALMAVLCEVELAPDEHDRLVRLTNEFSLAASR
jgi:hypothetical protein